MENNRRAPRKIFTVLIRDKEYDVFDFDGKEHEGYNDTPKTWWLYFSDRLPNETIPPCDSENWRPYCVGTLRRVWEIKIKQRNTTKEKWNRTQFNNSINVEMWCNGKLIYEFTSGGTYLDFAMAKIQYLQTIMGEHPYNFFEPEKENGRKICWYGLPATIKVKSNTWEVAIIPDYTAGINKEDWWKEYAIKTSKHSKPDEFDEQDKEEFINSKENDYINWGDAMSDGNIYWFRKA